MAAMVRSLTLYQKMILHLVNKCRALRLQTEPLNPIELRIAIEVWQELFLQVPAIPVERFDECYFRAIRDAGDKDWIDAQTIRSAWLRINEEAQQAQGLINASEYLKPNEQERRKI